MQKFSAALSVMAFAFGLFVLVVVPSTAFAHMAAGSDVEVGRYVVDIGWSPETPVAGEPAALAFNLGDKETDDAVDFDGVWVRISSGDDIAFAGTMRALGRNVTFTQAFPAAGEYEITARFLDAAGGTMVERTFPITVAASAAVEAEEKGSMPARSFPAVYALAAALVLLEIAVHSRRARAG